MRAITNKRVSISSLFMAVLACSQGAVAVTSVTDTACNSRLDVTIASTTRSSSASDADCQERALTAAGFALSPTSPSDAVTADSSAMVSAGGELYEAFVASAREAAVLLTPNRALMMSRAISGDGDGIDWDMGLAVQPVTSGTSAWLTGTYTLLRANREVRIVDVANQSNAGLSEVFDPVTLRIAFDGNSGCTVSNHSSWFSYSLTTDPAGGFSQPDGSDYGLHQAAYAGEGSGNVHEDSDLTFSDCSYTLASDGELLVTYDYTDGDANIFSVENAYFVSADLRYLVSTVNAGSDLYRGFEVGVRVPTLAGTQDENNDSVAGTYLFNAPSSEFQGSTGDAVDNINQHTEQATQCMGRGSLELSTTAGAAGFNTCTFDMTNTCSVRGEQDETPSVTLSHSTAEGVNAASSCEFQVASDGSIDFVINMTTAEGAQDVTFSGAVADNNESLILRGKYVGSDMADPSNSNAPERTIKNDLVVLALVAVKYEGSLVADADVDGLDNLGEFLFADYMALSVKNDLDADGDGDLVFQDGSGNVTVWGMENAAKDSASWLGASTYGVYALCDVDADSDTDIIFVNDGTGDVLRWEMENGAKSTSVWLGAQSGYSLSACGDLDADGDGDLVFNDASGNVVVWEMEAAAKDSSRWLGTWAGQEVMAAADVDADSDADIITQDVSGNVNIIEMQDADKVAATWVGVWSGRSIVGAGDADADGDADIFMENSGDVMVIEMENGSKVTGRWLGTWSGTEVKAVGDIDNDGDMDLIQQDTGSGSVQVVEIENAAKVTGRWLGTFAYDVIGVIDADADGDADVAMQDGSGNVALIELEGGSKVGGAKWLGVNSGDMKIFP